ncbi:serine/threonine-protein phosphatase 6 regulatory ankyrin repeat subunit C-like [Haliotis cracherodii]|uniref:serine/threonine-protein phosphatase 6 regulatory ankyrin repeat subunit C-like n=1 Tax=Haliotis cracherodii TaxID=6455 RepID=UPI0039EAC265
MAVQGGADRRFVNICESSKALISHDHTEYVSTFFERSALKLLKQHGIIFIKGRSGSGKSRLGKRLLSALAKQEGRTPLVLTSAEEWKLIPQRRGQGKCKYIAMIDNIFGSSNFVESTADEWSRLFNIMWPSVEAGHIYLIITSRPEISAQCERQLQNYHLMKNATHMTIDGGEYSLRPNEKKKMLKIICQNRTNFSMKDMEQIASSGSSIGFPQCCKYFAGSKQAQSKGVKFFLKPTDYIMEEVDRLQESDGLGYLVLLLVLLKRGCLETRELLTRQDTQEFQETLQIVKDICPNLVSYPSLANIRHKAESLCGIYLDHSENGFVFQHQSIFDSVFVSLSKTYPDICIKTGSVQMLVELVKTKQNECDKDLALHLTEENYGMLADRVTDILLTPETSRQIVDHPSLKDEVFIQNLLHKWTLESKMNSILQQKLNNKVQICCNEFSHGIEQMEIFKVEYLLSFIVLKHLNVLTTNIFSQRLDLYEKDVLQECLPCAIFVGNSVLVKTLLDFGLKPNASCFRALCMSRLIDRDISDIVCKCVLMSKADPASTESELEERFTWNSISNLDNFFKVAVLYGNVFVVEFVVKRLRDHVRSQAVFRHCLVQLFKELSVGYRSPEYQPYNMRHMREIISILLDTGCHVDFGHLTLLAATHLDTTAIKLLQARGVNVMNIRSQKIDPFSREEYYPTALQQAAAYGVELCLQELLELVENSHEEIHHMSKSLLFTAAKHGNTGCARLLLDRGVPVGVQDGKGNTPLHLAAKHNHVECVKMFIGKHAPVDITNVRGCIPMLWLESLCSPNMDIVKALVKAGSDIKGVDEDNKTILYRAAEGGDLATVKFLLRNGADVNVDVDDIVSNFSASMDEYQICKRAILVACRNADIDVLKFLHESGASIDMIDVNGETVLHKAARSPIDTIEKMQYILDLRGDFLQIQDNRGRTAAFPAVISSLETGDEEPLSFLLERGLSVNQIDKDGHKYNLLFFLLHNTFEVSLHTRTLDDITRMLLGKGLDPNDQDSNGKTVLHCAAEKQKGLLNTLLQAGADPTIKDNDGKSALHYVVEGRCSDNVKLLLVAGSDPCLQDAFGKTALHYATERGRIDNMKLLLETPIDMQIQDVRGKTALHSASELTTDVLKLLLDKGADPCIQDGLGKGALLYAVDSRNCASVRLLLERGADPCLSDKWGVTPLHRAALHNNGDCLKLLVAQNVNEHVQDEKCRTPLHYAAQSSNSDNLKLFLEKGINAGTRDSSGQTALHCAVECGNADSVKLLLEAGIDINLKDHQGKTALHYASAVNNADIVKLLQKEVADPNVTDHEGKTPLHYAAGNNSNESTTLLLEEGSNPCKKDLLGKTPLLYAAEKRNSDNAEVLLEQDADPSVTDAHGRTVLDLEAEKGCSGNLELLMLKWVDPCVKD